MLVEGGGRGPIVEGRALWLRVEEQVSEPWCRGLGRWWGCCFTAGAGPAAPSLGRILPSGPWDSGLLPTPGLRVRAHFSWQLSWAGGQVRCRWLGEFMLLFACIEQSWERRVCVCVFILLLEGRIPKEKSKVGDLLSGRGYPVVRSRGRGAVWRSTEGSELACACVPPWEMHSPKTCTALLFQCDSSFLKGCPRWQVGFTLC